MSDHITIKSDQLQEELNKILQEYGDEADRAVREVLPIVGKAGVKKIKGLSPVGDRKKNKYRDTWTATTISGRLYSREYIHQKAGKRFSNWRLVHLLVKGHMSRSGKFVPPAKEHYEPTQRFVEAEFMTLLKRELEK